MRNYIRVYPHSETEFENGGLGIIQNARDVCITQNTSGEYDLEFTLHPADEKMKIVNPENICVADGQRFRIKKVDDDKVSAVGIYQDAAFHHIQHIDDMIGKSPREIMCKIFEGTPIEVMSESAVRVLGMEWVTDLTDFFSVSKITPLGAMDTLIETLEKYRHHCEVYIDNYKIALVKQIGTDRGARIDTAYNAKEIKITRDTTEMITKLFPYGKEDLHIGSVNNGTQYITSENFDIYKKEGYQDFDEIEEADELLEAAKWLFDGNNPDRIDVPKYSINTSYAQRKDKEIRLGDIVTVIDRDYNIRTKQRVIEVKIYPFEPNRNEVTVGSPPTTPASVFTGMAKTSAKYENTINAKGEVKPSWLENLQGGYKTEVNKSIATSAKETRKTVIHDYGDIWVNPNNKNQALALIGGVMAMANGKDSNNDWDWTAFGDWTGFTASVINAGILNTSKVVIKSDDGNTQLSGNLLKMKDSDGTVRLKLGLDYGRYVFTLFDSSGRSALSLNDDGDLEMKGALDTTRPEEGVCGYIINGERINGYKFKGNKYVFHGLSTNSDEYGSHLQLYVEGKKALHIHSFEEDGVRKTAYAVNNTTDEKMSWRAFEVAEGAERATTKCWGDWDFSDAGIKAANKYGVTGEVSGGGMSMTLANGIVVGASSSGLTGYTGVLSVNNMKIHIVNGLITDVGYTN